MASVRKHDAGAAARRVDSAESSSGQHEALSRSTPSSGSELCENFMKQFRDQDMQIVNLTATQFMEVWNHYDTDGNGYIEGSELDGFLREFITSVVDHDQISDEVIGTSMLDEVKSFLMDAYDDNKDGRIEIQELAQLLPTEENFLMLFRMQHCLESSVEFMKIWREYDADNSGCIEADELKHFLQDLLLKEDAAAIISEEKLIEYTDTILNLFDTNKDGKLQLYEMAKLLPVRENFLCRPMFEGAKITPEDIERVFALYDRDHNGVIENEEINGFVKDLLELVKQDYDSDDLTEFRKVILKGCDINKDGKINKKELTIVLLSLSRKCTDEEEFLMENADE